MLIRIRDASTVEVQSLEFPGALVLALHQPLSLHDRAQWELAPDAVEGRANIYDLGRRLHGADAVTVRAAGKVVAELVLRLDEQGWHFVLTGAGGVQAVPLTDFDPEGSTGLGVSAKVLH